MSHKYLQNVFQWIEYFCVLKCNWVTENILIQLKLFANWRQETQFITNMELISSSWGTYQQEACYKWATTMYISCCAISLLNRDCRYQLLLFHCCCFILYRICEQFSKAFLSIILPEWKKYESDWTSMKMIYPWWIDVSETHINHESVER